MRDALLSALWVRVDIQPVARSRNRRQAEVEADAHIGFQGLRDQELNERRQQRFASLADVVGRVYDRMFAQDDIQPLKMR